MNTMPHQPSFAHLLGLIRAGSFPWVAARAAGFSDDAYREMSSMPSPERTEIERASAQSRARAEIELKEKNPLAWLRFGPGRPSRQGVGWTGAARAEALAWVKHSNAIELMNRVLSRIVEFGAKHPESRMELAGWLEQDLKNLDRDG